MVWSWLGYGPTRVRSWPLNKALGSANKSTSTNCDFERHWLIWWTMVHWWEWKGKGGNVEGRCASNPPSPSSTWFCYCCYWVLLVIIGSERESDWIGPKEKQRHCPICTALNDITCLNWTGQGKTIHYSGVCQMGRTGQLQRGKWAETRQQ